MAVPQAEDISSPKSSKLPEINERYKKNEVLGLSNNGIFSVSGVSQGNTSAS